MQSGLAEGSKPVEKTSHISVFAADDQPYEGHFAYEEVSWEHFDVLLSEKQFCELYAAIEAQFLEVDDDGGVEGTRRVAKLAVRLAFQCVL